MGPPGVGKGTQAARLAAHLGVPHVSTGDILREAVAGGSTLGRRVRPVLESGQLVTDDLMAEVIQDRLGRDDARRGFVLDGYPRTLPQVELLDGVLSRLGVALDRVFLLRAPEEEIVRRISGRRVCPACKAVYHIESRAPRSAGVCDACGSALVQRRDDTEELVRERLRVYAGKTLPAVAAYGERGMVREIDATGEPAAVFSRLASELAEA